MTQIVMPMHTNGVAGVMFGSIMMPWIDVCAGVTAMRHAGGAVLQAMVNFVARTSMEVGCRVETEDMRTRIRRYVTKAYLTFVAVDEHGRPRALLPLALDTDDDRRRHTAAQVRRHERLRAAGRTEHPA